MIRAWWWIGGSGMPQIDRGARIHRDNGRGLSVFAVGVVPVTNVVVRGFVLPGRRYARTGAGVPGVSAETSGSITYGISGVRAGCA